MTHEKQPGVPRFSCTQLAPKTKEYALLIPIINEGSRILNELRRAQASGVPDYVDIAILDGGSDDGSTDQAVLRGLGVNTLLVKEDEGRQGAQLRMGIYWAIERGYKGVVTVDGNDKDSIEDVPRFIEKLDQGCDFIQGSRFVKGGRAVNTPLLRLLSIRLIHAPVTSLAAGRRFTDTTNAFRGYSMRYLTDDRVQPLRDVFMTYELLAYLSTRATRIGLRACEVPVSRVYPSTGKTPTKITGFSGNFLLIKILFKNLFRAYDP